MVKWKLGESEYQIRTLVTNNILQYKRKNLEALAVMNGIQNTPQQIQSSTDVVYATSTTINSIPHGNSMGQH